MEAALKGDLTASATVLASQAVGAGVLIAFEGVKCIVDLKEMCNSRNQVPQDGKLGYSRRDFVEDVVTRISSALFSTTLGVLGGLVIVPGLGPVVGFVTSIICGSLGVALGQTLGELVGSRIGRAIASLVPDDRPVNLQQLSPGDTIIINDGVRHPRSHCIVVKVVEENGDIIVIRFKSDTGVTYEELLFDDQNPPKKVIYPENAEKYTPQEIVERAMMAFDSYHRQPTNAQ